MINSRISDAAIARRPAEGLLFGRASSRVPMVSGAVDHPRRIRQRIVLSGLNTLDGVLQVALIPLELALEFVQSVAAFVQLTWNYRIGQSFGED